MNNHIITSGLIRNLSHPGNRHFFTHKILKCSSIVVSGIVYYIFYIKKDERRLIYPS